MESFYFSECQFLIEFSGDENMESIKLYQKKQKICCSMRVKVFEGIIQK